MKEAIYKHHENNIPFNSKNRLITIPILVVLIAVVVIPTLLYLAIALATGIPLESLEEQFISMPVAIANIISVCITLWLFTKVSKITIKDLGLGNNRVLTNILVGIICGVLAISVIALIINLLGGAITTYHFKPEHLATLAMGVVFFAFQGTFEELVFRAYLMPHLSKALGIVPAILITSALFTLPHWFNPGMTLLPIVNIMLASIVFALLYYNFGNLWLVGSIHGAWNYAQGFIYGSPVSGIYIEESIFRTPTIDSTTPLISGSVLGFEGSVVTSAALVIVIVALSLQARKFVTK